LVYLFIPIVTGVILSKPVQLIPIPFIDFTSNTESLMPAAWSALTGDLGAVMVGFVLPFPVVLGSFISSVFCKIGLNPILFKAGMFPHWTYGTPYLQTKLATDIDFWMSVTIGTALGIGIIGLGTVFHSLAQSRGQAQRPTMKRSLPEGRGDWNLVLSVTVWFVATICQVLIARALVPDFPWWIMAFYGFIYTPAISYVSGRLIGITGMFGVGFPFLKEATIIKSGYRKADIWFVGIPMHDMGGIAQKFREVELTGTKFTSVVKTEILMLLVILPTSFLFWSFFWRTSPIPSAQYPFVQKMWPVTATMQSIWWTANRGSMEENFLLSALRFPVIVGAGFGTLVAYGVAMMFKVPLMFFYGFVGGIGGEPMGTIPTFAGALLGRYYLGKRFGDVKWKQYAPVLVAGFGCGTGLTAMTGIAFALITKSVNYLPF